jgi:argininosuccinate lyase
MKDIFRSRLDKPLSEKARRFLSSLEEDLEFFEEEILVNIAHVSMLYKQGIIDEKEASSLINALKEIKQDELKENKDFEDIHEFIEAKLIERVGEAAMKLQSGKSRNDDVATITRMKIRKLLLEILDLLLKLSSTLLERAKKDKDVILIYRTHRRDAQISNLSHYWLAQLDSLIRNAERIIEAYKRCNLSPLGSSACAGTMFPIDREFTARILAFDGILENSLDAVTSRDFIIDALHVAVSIMIDISRISEDLIYWSEKRIIELDDSHCSSSSIMPHKKNPDVLELLKAKAKEVISIHMAIIEILSSLPSGYNRELQRVKIDAVKGLNIVKESLDVIREVIFYLKPNKIVSLKLAKKSESIATDLAELLATELNVPFREAHKKVGSIFKVIDLENIENGIEKIVDSLGLKEKSVDFNELLMKRKSLGSPNLNEIDRLIKSREIMINTYKEILNDKMNKILKAMEEIKRIQHT